MFHILIHTQESLVVNVVEPGLPEMIWHGHILCGAITDPNKASHGRKDMIQPGPGVAKIDVVLSDTGATMDGIFGAVGG